MGFKPKKLERPVPVKNVDGTPNKDGQLTHCVHLCVRLKLAFCTTCAVRVLVLAQGPSFLRLRRAFVKAKRGFTR